MAEPNKFRCLDELHCQKNTIQVGYGFSNFSAN